MSEDDLGSVVDRGGLGRHTEREERGMRRSM